MPPSVVTRFAPSPTGYLHIGGARTALFNWLYARGRGGQFLLRIEDTDRARHNEAAVDAIIDGLSWLGLDWDGEPVSQYARRDRHAEVAHALLERGAAYRCYMTPEEIEAARMKAQADKSRFESPWRTADPRSAPDRPYTIRFKAPREGETRVSDVVQGDVRFPNSALDDLIVLRSDGAPTYNLAVVVDDHDMGVTHIIRGDDHLNNAARQQQIYAAMDWPAPSFSHVPLIHGQDGAKLSKRHGALGVEAYRDLGFLPEGLANYLLRLGWAHGDDEFIPRDKALQWFDITGVNKAPARLDLAKLESINAQHMRALNDAEFVQRCAPFLSRAGYVVGAEAERRLLRAAPFLKERSPTLAATPDAAKFLLIERPLALAGKAAKALEKPGARDLLKALAQRLQTADWASPAALDAAVKDTAAAAGVALGEIGPAARAALTAGEAAPALGETMHALGRAEALARLADAF